MWKIPVNFIQAKTQTLSSKTLHPRTLDPIDPEPSTFTKVYPGGELIGWNLYPCLVQV